VVRTSDLEIAVERLKDRLRAAGLDPGDEESRDPSPRP